MIPNIGIIYGSETGNTEYIAEMIEKEWGADHAEVHNIFNMELSVFEQYPLLILGIPSWYDGQLQGDWEAIFDDLDDVNFKDRVVAIYGLGDQQDWGDYFVDALGSLAKKVKEQGAILIGEWSVDGYEFIESQAVNEEGHFYGLVIDEDWQSEMSKDRVKSWIVQLKGELKNLQLMDVA